MDPDEILAFAVCAAAALWGATKWYGNICRVSWLRRRTFQRILLAITPIGCLLLLEISLRRWAAIEVRSSVAYQALFLAGGGAWLSFANALMPLLGIDPCGDALERGNPAATLITCAAMLGITFCYSGANIGEGAAIWMTFFPAIIAPILLFGCWLFLNLVTPLTSTIIIERDVGWAGILSALLISNGLILGRAAAGNWVSVEHTLVDFARLGWPAAALTALVTIAHCIAFQWRSR